MSLAISKYDTVWTSTQQERIGAGYYDPQGGRVFHYSEDGGSGVARGKLAVGVDIVANHVNLSFQTAPAAGDKVVKVTLGATAAAQDLYKDGWLNVQDGTGEGRAYPVEGNMATDSAGTCILTLKEGIDTAGALSEANVDLHKNLYKDIKISVADQADVAVGVPIVAATASYFGWVQTWGAAAVLQDETTAIGQQQTIGSSVVGALELQDAAGENAVGIQGNQTAVDTEYTMVYLKLDPIIGNSG